MNKPFHVVYQNLRIVSLKRKKNDRGYSPSQSAGIRFDRSLFQFITPVLLLIVLCTLHAHNLTGQLDLRYFGTAGWEMTDGKITILVDPYISRIKLGEGPGISEKDNRQSFTRTDYYQSDTLLINEVIQKADFILVHHSHFDHLSDVPYIAQRTGAKVIASETSCKILRAYGIPEEKLYTIKGGEDYQFDGFSVRVIPSLHSPLNGKRYFDSRSLPDDLHAPLKVSDFIEGGSFMFLVRFDSHKVLTMGSMNFIERELTGLRPDVLLAGVNFSRNEIFNYTGRLLKVTGFPKIIIPSHWDNFRIPYGFSQQPGIDRKIRPFIEEVKATSPASEVIIPVHLETIKIK